MDPNSADTRRSHILTVALEDYFHGPAFSKVISKKRWGHFETRFEQNCLDVLDKLDQVSAQATFFANSWVARKSPAVLREVIRRGHEIALAGQRNTSFRHLNRVSLREQVQRDRDILEQQALHKVLGFRVTDTLLRTRDLWALKELASLGFRYDSSLSPFLRSFKGEPWRQHVHINRTLSGDIWELPIASHRISGLLVPFGGGNYFRQFPEFLIEKFLTLGNLDERHPLVLYFRLWDFDSKQPRLQTGSLLRDLRHYRNSDRMLQTMENLLGRFRFSSIAGHLKLDVPELTASPAAVLASVKFGSTRRTSLQSTPVSVIVPCFNEEEGIPFLASNLAALKAQLGENNFDAEFILVDDGSSDNTWSLLRRHFADDPSAIIVQHPRNLGVSAAITTGLRHAREIACSMDCDCSYDPAELRPMLQLLTPDVDLVTASPYHPSGAVLNVPRWRLLLSRASSALYRVVTGRRLHTFTACVRVYRRSSVVNVPLKYTGFLGVAELLSRLALDKKKIVEHPATLEVRIFGQSKMKVVRTIFGHLKLLAELSLIRLQAKPVPHPVHSKLMRFPVTESVEVEVEKS